MNTPDKVHQPCKIVGISGSIRSGSYTTLAVRLALKGAEELDCQTKLIDLRDYQLLFCDGKNDESQFPKDVFRLREEVKEADGIVLGTPEYHGGYSGVLKNALFARLLRGERIPAKVGEGTRKSRWGRPLGIGRVCPEPGVALHLNRRHAPQDNPRFKCSKRPLSTI
jgi:hypothetical protein